MKRIGKNWGLLVLPALAGVALGGVVFLRFHHTPSAPNRHQDARGDVPEPNGEREAVDRSPHSGNRDPIPRNPAQLMEFVLSKSRSFAVGYSDPTDVIAALSSAPAEVVSSLRQIVLDPWRGEVERRVLALLLSISGNSHWQPGVPDLIRMADDDFVALAASMGLALAPRKKLLDDRFWADFTSKEVADALGLPSSPDGRMVLSSSSTSGSLGPEPMPGHSRGMLFGQLSDPSVIGALLQRSLTSQSRADLIDEMVSLISFEDDGALSQIGYLNSATARPDVQLKVIKKIGVTKSAVERKVAALTPFALNAGLDGGVRIETMAVLVRLQGQETRGLLMQLRDTDPDENVRSAATSLLMDLN